MGSVSRLRSGNQAKKAHCFKVSVFDSHVGPGSAKSDSFLCSFLGLPPTSSFSGVVAGTGIVLSPDLTETKDHEMDGAGAGRSSRCDPRCGQPVGAESFVSDLQDTIVPVSCALSADVDGARCFENTGDYHVPKLHGELDVAGDSARLRRAGGRRTFSSSLSVKRCSSSTLSRSQARCCPSACAARAEAGGGYDSFESLFDRCADPVTRFRRATSVIHAHSTARNSQFEHSRAKFAGRHRSWGTTLLCTRGNKVTEYEYQDRGQAFCCESAHTQQAPLKLHEETWEGLLWKQEIFRKVEIVPGCFVKVACPSCPDYSSGPPGPDRVIRNMLGWSQLDKTARSGVWLFRGALQGENLFSLLIAAGDWETKLSYRTAWPVPCDSSCTCSYAYGRGPAIGPHTGKRCWPLLAGVWRAIAPLMQPWCAEGEVLTAANLNLYRGWKSCVGWHCDDEPLFGKCGDAKLIVSVSLGNFALFRWKRQSCPADEGRSCRLDHGDILVIDGQCQDEFLHRTDPGREQERINITFRWVKQHVSLVLC